MFSTRKPAATTRNQRGCEASGQFHGIFQYLAKARSSMNGARSLASSAPWAARKIKRKASSSVQSPRRSTFAAWGSRIMVESQNSRLRGMADPRRRWRAKSE